MAEKQTGTSRFVASARLGRMHAVRDLVRRRPHLHVAFVLDAVPSAVGRALHVVRVAVVRAHADRVGLGQLGLDVLLRHDVLADHAPRLADVELVRPVIGVDELVAAEAPRLHLGRSAVGTRGSLARK